MKYLPLGYQSFEEIRLEDKLYIDKTEWIWKIVSSGKTFFLSRPRRFGKSLLVSTLECLFKGKKELFEELAIAGQQYNWQKYPVITLRMNGLSTGSLEELETSLNIHLRYIAENYNVTIDKALKASDAFFVLINELNKTGSVVILIDEYDKPLLDQLGKEYETEDERKQRIVYAHQVRDFLKEFYGKLKPTDSMLKFLFVTGVSKFTRTSVFSELNHLTDLSLNTEYADLLGYTEYELNTYFSDYMPALEAELNIPAAKLREHIRHWYNGFRFTLRDVRVYNPYSILSVFYEKQFNNYWFETGTPTFLINLIRDKGYPAELFSVRMMEREAFSTWDIDNLNLWPLMFQTGYLTINKIIPSPNNPLNHLYELDFPNEEVRVSMMNHLLTSLSGRPSSDTAGIIYDLIQHLLINKLDAFFNLIKSLIASIGYELHIADEHYYQSLLFVVFALIGMKPRAEEQTHDGRIDMVVETPNRIYIFEFKLNKPAQAALDQIHEKKYAQKFVYLKKQVTLVGVAIDSEKRMVSGWLVEEI